MKLQRIVSLLLALSMLLCLFAGCGKNTGGDETTTAPEETTTTIQPAEAVVAELSADGTVTLVKNTDGSPLVVLGSDGVQYAIPADSTAEAVKDEQGVINAILLNTGVSIPVALSADGTKLIVSQVFPAGTEIEETTVPGTTALDGASTTKKAKSNVMEREDVKAILNDSNLTAIQKAEAVRNLKTLTDAEKVKVIEQIPGLSEEQRAAQINEVAVLSYKYSSDGYFYTDDSNAWQRNFGYNKFYDLAASYVVMYYDTVRVKFNHNNLDWMIQLWKGQYGYLFLGSEIGVYTKDPKKSADHYDCASNDNLLDMSMSLFRVNKLTNEHTLLFNRDFGPHWWITGFSPGILNSFSKRDELILVGSICFKDNSMAQKFASGLAGAGFSSGSPSHNNVDKYSVSGAVVTFSWRYIDQGLGRVKTGGGSSSSKETTTAKAQESTEKEITVKFNANGGSVSKTSAQYVSGKAYGSLPTPTRDGYKFIGWFDRILLGNKITATSIVGKSDLTLYARWDKEEEKTETPETPTEAPVETPTEGGESTD